MAQIHERTSELSNAFQVRDIVRCIRGGTQAMRDAAERYLPREKAERRSVDQETGISFDPYRDRLKRSVLTNIPSEAVSRMVGKVLRKPTQATADYARHQQLLETLLTDLDGQGSDLYDLQLQLLTEAIWNGSAAILTDFINGRAVAYFVHIDDILQADYVDGELVAVRIREFEDKMNFDDMTKDVVKTEKAYIKNDGIVYWSRFSEGANGVRMQGEWVQTDLDNIPLFVFKAGEVLEGCGIACRSAVQNLIELAVLHWNKSSDHENILHIANVPQLFAKGIASDEQLYFGVNRVIVSSDENADLKWVEPGGTTVKYAMESLDRLEARMEAMGFSFVTPRSGAAETATGRALKANESNSVLGGIARNLGVTLQKVFEQMLSYYKLSRTPVVSVSVNTDFGVSISADELNALASAYQSGALSRHYYIKELIRRGVLDGDMDTEENALRLQEELDANI
ncbi:DUF4055 domain-containing protein [Billgrantia antri]|uniref:DUF4055 domain-containing protein n=1 Tax=Halomonas sulfidivorans TaxID=2733488 RepID=A0ABX7WIW5_9GAMM|nr:DUF4055 domain-containing protein [Halomonas sulfidivorans]QTP59547.1 DUF4055 domain-containing protein [Halomonas sulfidivorans]